MLEAHTIIGSVFGGSGGSKQVLPPNPAVEAATRDGPY